MAKRANVNDFIASINQVAGHTVTVAKDGTLAVAKNSVTVHPKIFYTGGGAVTDANPQGDRVVFIRADGTMGSADAQVFINSLK